MAVNNSDYNKPRTNLLDVTNETFKSETATSLIENTFNRMLSKDETVEISGTIGDADPAARVDRRIAEDDVHRQGFQLQPLMYTKVATVDHAKSTKDLYNQLTRLGVDVDRLPVWGDTERFNFAPPVDLDKLTNFTDYYWYDDTDTYTVPQYVVIKNRCAAHTARLSQKQREIAGIGESTPIFNASAAHNTISLLGNLTKNFPAGTQFDIVGSLGVDGLYEVVSVEFKDNFTVITPSPALPSAQYGGGAITFDTIERELTQNKNAICDGSAGWDSSSWDDSERSMNGGVYIDDAMLLAYLKVQSIDTYNLIIRKHPEYLDVNGNIVATDARPLWSWMDQPKPEFIYNWDATGATQPLNDWQIENKWIHKLDLPAGAIAKSKRASLPILEYLPNLEMNEWSYTAHNWMYRESPTRDEFAAIDREPTDAEYAASDFLDKWIYVGPAETVPVNHQTESTVAKVMSIDSKDASYMLSTYIAGQITQLSPSTRKFVVVGDYRVSGVAQIHTPDGIYSVTVQSAVYDSGKTTVTLVAGTSFTGITDGDLILYPSGTRPFNAVLFSTARSTVAVAGQQNTRVYVDGREQVGNYSELLKHSNGLYFVNGVFMDDFTSKQSQFEIGIDPSAEVDKNRALWNVRTFADIDDQVFKAGGRKTTAICPIRFRLHQQRKTPGVTKFPLFDIYYPTGETAYRANELFTFVIDHDAAVDFNIGLRIKRTNSKKVYHYKQLLLDYDNGPMYCYKDFDEVDTNPSALFTIWRTSENVRYIPRYVDENKHADGEEYYVNNTKYVAEVPYGSGDWEVPSQLYFNSSHENRVEVSSIQLLEHVKTILRGQETVEGFLPNAQYGHRLLEKIDYSIGGTIHEHNDSWDLLASSLFATNSTPTDILNFAATSYETAVNAQEEFVLSHAYAALIDTSVQYIGNLTAAITNAALNAYEANDNNNRLFGDTSAWINNKGVQSWPASSPILGMTFGTAPMRLIDNKLDISEIQHHDGHLSFNRITQGAMVSIAKRVVRTQVKITNTVSRYRGWTPQQAADKGVVYASYSEIPVSKLAAADYWLNGTEFKRFEVVSITPFMPSVDSPIGSLWLRSTDNQLMTKVDDDLQPWIPLKVNGVAVAPGNVAPAWKTIDLTEVLNELLMVIEKRLYEATLEHNHTELAFPKSKYVLSDADAATHQALMERMFKEFVVSRQIAYPYASVYVQTNPFTWNVSGIDPSTVRNPFADSRAFNWKATWEGNYREIYGTFYPHLQPWILQGFTSKPTWWDTEYADTTGTRRWKAAMWTNVINNDVPAAYTAPAAFTTVTVSGKSYKRMAKKFTYVPVNTVRVLKNTAGDTLYALDDLFPVYDSRLLTAAFSDVVNSTSIGRPLVHTIAGASVNFKAAYKFGDVSPIELEWLKSTQYIIDQQKIAFLMQPMRYMHNTWGNTYLSVGGLNINRETLKVFAHEDTIFHGDVIDGTTYQAVGLNQWYSYYIRQTGIDFKVSNLREMWTTWKAKLAYQFGGFVNTKSLIVRTSGTNLIKEDYTIFSKKSPGYDSMWLDSLNVTVANYGASSVRRGVRIPQGDGKDWTFTVSLPADTSRVVNYYGTRRFTFTVEDEDTGLMKIDGAVLPWTTGDMVYIDSTKYLPFPLDTVYQYYVAVVSAADGTFKLARTAGNAHNGEGIQLRTSGEGVQYIGEVHSTFFAYGGTNTDVAWKHHVVDKAQVLELASPFTVQGIQGLIDVIDGYIAYKKDEGFVFNDSSEKETDWNTSRLVSWQTETERAIDTIYKGLGLNNSSVRQYGTTQEVELVNVEDDPDVFRMKNGSSPFQFADRIVFFTTGTLPTGLALNTTYFAIPDEDDNTKFRVASTAQNAYDEIGINVTSEGTGTLHVGSFASPTVTADSVVEINPFRYNLWITTPKGILADVFTGGDSSNSSEVLMYDQYGRPIPKGAVMVFRKDRQAHLKVRPIMVNDVLVDNANPTMYNLIHLGGIKAYIDGYEHVVIFNDYAASEQMIYDAFVGMSVPRFGVEFQRAENRNLRPNIGGYYKNGADMLRNIEASIDDMRSYYRTYDVNENSDYVDHARALLGYEPPAYLDHLNTPLKSKFLFWKGMIQQKGSRNAVRSFINSEHFVDAKVDEFWAYKLADFGDARPRFKPRIRLSIADTANNDVRLEFVDEQEGPTNDSRFNQITLAEQTRWVDLPTTRKDLDGRNMIFNARAKSFIFDVPAMSTMSNRAGRLAVIPHAMEWIVVEKENGIGWTQITTFTLVNSRAIAVTGVTTGKIRITGYVPDVQSLDPIELIDTKSSTVVQRTKYWNPIAGNHYHVPLTSIDFMCDIDPAQYVSVDDWAANKVGTTWVDTSTFKYIPYEDKVIFPNLNDRSERWGRLASYAQANVYEWVASSVLPSMYVDDETTTGTPFTIWTKQNDEMLYDEVDLSPIESWVDHQTNFAALASRDQTLDLTVYVNGVAVDNYDGLVTLSDVLANGTLASQYGTREQDYVTFVLTPTAEQVEATEYVQDYKYIKVEGSTVPTYYFWVSNKAERGSLHSSSVVELKTQLTKPQVPYHIFTNCLKAARFTQRLTNTQTKIVPLPVRYTQVIVKDIANKIAVDNRYALQFTRYFNLRDDLNVGVSALDLKNKHTEWYIFRQEQSDKIPEALWNLAAEAVVGYKLTDLDNGVLTPVPSLERVVYDNTFGETSRFGLGDGQAFMDRAIGLNSVQKLLESVDFDTAPVDKYDFLDSYSFDTPVNIRKAMKYMFVNFSSEAVNTMFFELLQDALAGKRDYPGLFKTSWIALHGIKILETVGNVTE